ncbi:unnamed protein product [Prunus brigantina]
MLFELFTCVVLSRCLFLLIHPPSTLCLLPVSLFPKCYQSFFFIIPSPAASL